MFQLKKIARRYKSQCDELTKEKDELNKKLAEDKPENPENPEQENAIKTLNEEKKSLQDEVEKLTQLSSASKVKGNVLQVGWFKVKTKHRRNKCL